MPAKHFKTILSNLPDPFHVSRTINLNILPWLGIAFGLTLTTSLWQDTSSQSHLILRWISYTGITIVGLYLLVRSAHRRGFVLLALFASVSLVYLFPALLGPGCDGMPKAFAVECGRIWDCEGNECCRGGRCLSDDDPRCGGEEPPPVSPPTISGTISCSMGSNGWCLGGLALNLSASDPQGRQIIISGDVNGNTFSCPVGDVSCPVQITTEGYGTINYRVDSATGLSAVGTASYQLDATTPQIDGSLNGAGGTNGWFVSEVDFSASASDAVSGLASLEISVDSRGGAYLPYSPITLGDGTHTVAVRALDYAGNVAETTQVISVDTINPFLDIYVNGATGSNNWYVSETEVSALANDDGSGLFSLEVNVDGGGWQTYVAPILLSDGIHNVQFRAIDHAGNVTTTGQEVKVDTITPSLTLSVSGTEGLNGWYISDTQNSATASDAGSGVATLEAAVDGGAWSIVSSPLSLSDGVHTWKFRVRDNAGNLTESPVQTIRIDTIAPIIEMTEELSLGETLYYELTDPSIRSGQAGSGLANYRAVIEDDAEKYKKISWVDSMSGDKVQGEILWDGKFKDGTKAGTGEYFITLKISDAAGNETMKSAVASVTLFSFLQNLPAFSVPQDTVTSNETTSEQAASATTSTMLSEGIGGASNGTTAEKTSSSTSAGGIPVEGKAMSVHTWTKESQTTNSPIPTSNILWGAAATALVGATLADWKKKRDEEELAKRLERQERLQTNREQGGLQAMRKAEKERDDAVRKRWADAKVKSSRGTDWKLNRIENAEGVSIAVATQAKKEVREEQRKAEELQAGLAAYYQGRKAGETNVTPQESWWDKTLNWIDNHQTVTSIGVGGIVGLAAIGIILAVGVTVTLPFLAVAAGITALVAGVTVAAGTVALNTHYDRPPTTNIWDNVKASAITAAVVCGVGLFITGGLLTQAVIATGNAVAGTCAAHQAVCANMGTVLNAVDTLEEVSLTVQLVVETAIGNPHAGETAAELQLEKMDGGIPGNSIAAESAEILAKLGDEVPDLIAIYGDEIVPLLLKYGYDAVDIISTYGDEGVALLFRFGDDAGEAINLVNRYGMPAVKLLDIVDPASANKMLMTLDDDVLDYVMKKDSDAVLALSRWSKKDLMGFGPELALRAEKDAKVLKAVNSLIDLAPVDPKNLTDRQEALIKIIAENSMQYSDEGQIVLGKWVDYGNGFTSYARETGSVHYNPHPDMWDLFGKLGDAHREETAWLVNKQVIQIGIDKGLPFEYTLNGINPDTLNNEMEAIEVVWSGADDADILKVLDDADRVDIPIRLKELKELYNARYQFSYDAATTSYILTKP